MTLHLIKLCVGAENVADLEDWVEKRVAHNRKRGLGDIHDHVTRMFPKKRDALLDGGSIYWVIKGVVLVRQRIADLSSVAGEDGVTRCMIALEPPLIPTEAQPRRAFQGWRYLPEADAPRDYKGGRRDARLQQELAELGLL